MAACGGSGRCRTGKQENLAIIQRIVKETGLKVEVGGGVRSREAVENLANAGASRIVLGTVLVKDPDFAQAAVEEYGDLLAAGIERAMARRLSPVGRRMAASPQTTWRVGWAIWDTATWCSRISRVTGCKSAST